MPYFIIVECVTDLGVCVCVAEGRGAGVCGAFRRKIGKKLFTAKQLLIFSNNHIKSSCFESKL